MALKRRARKTSHSVYGTAYNLKKNKTEYIILREMSDGEIYMIGMATINWAYLEHVLLLETAKLVNRAKLSEMPSGAVSMSFDERLKAWRKMVTTTVKTKSAREQLLKLASKIANAARTRHQITHGLWEWYPSNPRRLRAYSYRPRVEFNEQNLSFEKLRQLAQNIAKYAYELGAPLTATTPVQNAKRMRRGKLANLKEHNYAYMSRHMLLDMIGEEHGRLVPESRMYQTKSQE